jgi:hypothetical protein
MAPHFLRLWPSTSIQIKATKPQGRQSRRLSIDRRQDSLIRQLRNHRQRPPASTLRSTSRVTLSAVGRPMPFMTTLEFIFESNLRHNEPTAQPPERFMQIPPSVNPPTPLQSPPMGFGWRIRSPKRQVLVFLFHGCSAFIPPSLK